MSFYNDPDLEDEEPDPRRHRTPVKTPQRPPDAIYPVQPVVITTAEQLKVAVPVVTVAALIGAGLALTEVGQRVWDFIWSPAGLVLALVVAFFITKVISPMVGHARGEDLKSIGWWEEGVLQMEMKGYSLYYSVQDLAAIEGPGDDEQAGWSIVFLTNRFQTDQPLDGLDDLITRVRTRNPAIRVTRL